MVVGCSANPPPEGQSVAWCFDSSPTSHIKHALNLTMKVFIFFFFTPNLPSFPSLDHFNEVPWPATQVVKPET